MTPGARIAAAIRIIDDWHRGEEGLDRVLATWGRGNRYAGSGDRHAIADLVYDAVRRLRSALWVAGTKEVSGRAALIGSLRLDGAVLADLFTGEGHSPPPLTAAEMTPAALADAPEAVALDLPDHLMTHVAHLPREALAELRHRAPLDLRVNLLKADVAVARAALSAEGIKTEPGPLGVLCLRVTEGARRVARSAAYRTGLVEIQDAASQAVAAFAAAQMCETVLDFCAGGGGKTLALGAEMGGEGRLIAHDVSARRLAALQPRAERAGLRVELRSPGQTSDLCGACDLVLVDAPCSGSGAWRRNPDAKWRLSHETLVRLVRTQDEVLATAAPLLRAGGRLVYATCSVLEIENEARVTAFTARHPQFSVEAPALSLLPGRNAGDGFFACRLRRRPA